MYMTEAWFLELTTKYPEFAKLIGSFSAYRICDKLENPSDLHIIMFYMAKNVDEFEDMWRLFYAFTPALIDAGYIMYNAMAAVNNHVTDKYVIGMQNLIDTVGLNIKVTEFVK